MREINWKWYPSPPEMLMAEIDGGPCYVFECVGTCNGDRVWLPDSGTGARNVNVKKELKEKHGMLVESLGEARQLDGFVESYNQHSAESDKNYEIRKSERFA